LVNFNMSGLVLRLIENLSRSIPVGATFEVIVADNSTDEAKRLSRDSLLFEPRARLLSLSENRGFVDALNHIIPLSQGRWVCIMHPDVELKDGCLAALSEFLVSHPRAAVVGPDLRYPNGEPCKIRLKSPTVRSELRRLANMFSHIVLGRWLMRGEYVWDRKGDACAETVMSVVMLFRREALLSFDCAITGLVFYFCNDLLCHRVRRNKWTCHYVRDARAVHFERYSPTDMYSPDPVMAYKRSTVTANPRMRSDYFRFLTLCYPVWRRVLLRLCALVEDSTQVAAHMCRPRRGLGNMSPLWRSVLVDLGLHVESP
jgi:GT2 family glycosyltransferase